MRTSSSLRGEQEGRAAYLAEKSLADNPYPGYAYPYTDQGLACAGWRTGWLNAWAAERCPPERCQELANTAFAVQARASATLMSVADEQ